MKIFSVALELLQEEKRTDGQADMTELISTFLQPFYANALGRYRNASQTRVFDNIVLVLLRSDSINSKNIATITTTTTTHNNNNNNNYNNNFNFNFNLLACKLNSQEANYKECT
jgi:hypothetical protein